MISKLTFVIVSVSLCVLGTSLHGADGDGLQRQLIEGAKKEGKLVFYTSVETEFARSLTSGFEAKYPFIKTDIFRSTHERILSRMNVERKTGTYTADAVSVGEFETYHMQKMGFITPYKSPYATAYPEGFKDPNGYWTDLYDNLIVTAYNSNRVKRDELPARLPRPASPALEGSDGARPARGSLVRQYALSLGRTKGYGIHASVSEARSFDSQRPRNGDATPRSGRI